MLVNFESLSKGLQLTLLGGTTIGSFSPMNFWFIYVGLHYLEGESRCITGSAFTGAARNDELHWMTLGLNTAALGF